MSVEDVSVYGTAQGFRGHAKPGDALVIDSAWEYSLTRKWVLALDVVYQRNASTVLQGVDSPGSGVSTVAVRAQSGSGEVINLAPAVEYNWSSRMGVIAGTLFCAAGRNTGATFTPVLAINMVF